MRTKVLLVFFAIISYVVISSCNKDDEQSDQKPTCLISSPHDGEEISLGEKINISVIATSNNTKIREVYFFIDDEEKGLISNYPYNYLWNTDGESSGKHTIKATSMDILGASESDLVTVYITEDSSTFSPNANFTANMTDGSSPLTVNFIDLSTNNPTSWQWYFGDGESSTMPNPTHTFSIDGYYSIKLIISNKYASDTLQKINYIHIGPGGADGEPCPETPIVMDADGNIYNTVMVGNRCWMKENLRVGQFTNSDVNMSNNNKIEKYCYNDTLLYCLTQGALYQWDEIMQYDSEEGQQGICPDGWHLPSDDEWKQLEIHLGMDQNQADQIGYRGTLEGNELKSEEGWYNNGNGSNSARFSAKPGGYRYTNGTFRDNSFIGSWWSSTQNNSSRAWRRGLNHNSKMVRRNHHDKTDGLSVRCVKN